jgi:hypothetical protein
MDRYDLTIRLVIDSQWSYAEPDQWNWHELLLIEPDGRVTVAVVDQSAPAAAPVQPEHGLGGFGWVLVWILVGAALPLLPYFSAH